MTARPASGDLSEASRFFLALSDATRLALLAELQRGERTVGELVQALGCAQPKVSRHLRVLRDAGLVRDRKDGRNVFYVLATSSRWGVGAREWLDRLDAGLPADGLLSSRPSGAVEAPHRAREIEDFLL